jgi:hypothetical protein
LARLVDGVVSAAGAVIAVLAVLAAVGTGVENVVQEKFDCADSSGPVGSSAVAIGAFWGLFDGKHGTNLFLASRREYTPKRFAAHSFQLSLLARRWRIHLIETEGELLDLKGR